MVEVRPAHRPHRPAADCPTGEESARSSSATRLAGITFAQVFSSPLSRAQRTAELAGFAPEIEPDLLEWDYGDYEGLKSAEIARAAPGLEPVPRRRPGGESPGAGGRARVDRLVAKLKALTGNVLCFAHGHILRVLAARWIDQSLTFGTCLLLGTATLSILSFNHHDSDEPAIKVWNS